MNVGGLDKSINVDAFRSPNSVWVLRNFEQVEARFSIRGAALRVNHHIATLNE